MMGAAATGAAKDLRWKERNKEPLKMELFFNKPNQSMKTIFIYEQILH